MDLNGSIYVCMPHRFRKKKLILPQWKYTSKYIYYSLDKLYFIKTLICHAYKLTFVKVHFYSPISYICRIQKNTFDFSFIFSLKSFFVFILIADVFNEGRISVSQTYLVSIFLKDMQQIKATFKKSRGMILAKLRLY